MASRKPVNNSDDPVIQRMLDNYQLSADAFSDDRSRGRIALKFRRGGADQWDAGMYRLRNEGNRPTESYNQIPQFLHQVTNDQRMNMPQTRFIAGNDGSEEVAEAYEDYIRNVQASSEAEVAYDAACDNQVTIGWGYWRYVTEYESDNSFDQNIALRWCPNVFNIYDDPNCVQQDFLDRRFLLECYDLPLIQFNKENDRQYDDGDTKMIGDKAPDWATKDTVRVVEYWERTDKIEKLYRVNGKTTKDKPKGEIDPSDVRDVVVPKITWYKCTATEVLETREWPGKYIPYVRISGEMLIIDGKTYYSGMVEGMMSAQRQYNHWSNTATEIMGMVPLAPYIMDPRQIEGYEKFWDAANVKKYPYLPALATVDGLPGTVLPMPQRNSASADISGALALVQQAQNNFYTTSGIFPASLGQQGNESSGKAINARKVEGDVSTFHYTDNLARGQRAGGRICADLIPKILDASRVIKGRKEDGTTREIKVNQKFKDKKTGEMKELDLTVGTYDVMVTTGPSFTTRRQESADAMLTLASQTNLMEIAPDLFYRAQDWPGADKIADRYKAALPVALTEESDEEPIPPQVKNQLAQQEKAIQQLTAGIQQLEQQLESKQADIAKAQADIDLKRQEMVLNDQQDARQKALDMQKIQAQREQSALELLKLELTSVEGATPKERSAEPETIEHEADDENVLLAKVNQIRQKREQDALNQQAMQEMAMQEQAIQVQTAEMEMQNEQNKMLIAQTNLQKLDEIHTGLMMLTKAITADRKVLRDPITGMTTGVVTVDTVGSA